MSEGLIFLAQTLVSGFSLGSLYALVAVGFVVIYKSTRVLNFAQGELMMLGTYLVLTLVQSIHVSFGVALVLAVLLTGVIGYGVERTLLRPMLGEPLFTLIMLTIGLSFLVRGVVGVLWGAELVPFEIPFAAGVIRLGGAVISRTQLVGLAGAVILLAVFVAFYRYSSLGLSMRATASHQDTASLMGIDIGRIYGASWAISAAASVVAGVALASITHLSPATGFFGLRALPALLLGGLDSIPGAVAGGFIVGLIESAVGGYVDPIVGAGTKEVTAYIVLLLILIVRPYGFFGTREIERV